MTTAELVYERVKLLPEPQVLRVLDFVEQIPLARRLTAVEIMQLPRETRRQLLQERLGKAAGLYATDPALKEWVEVVDDYVEYDTAGAK